MPKFTNRDFALSAYHGMIEKISELQQRIALAELLQEKHGSLALPIAKLRRIAHPRQQTLVDAPDLLADELRSANSRLDKLYDMVSHLETMFRKYLDADDKEFAMRLRKYFNERTGK